jgi:copper oxidase (laccase) domain-containing protein
VKLAKGVDGVFGYGAFALVVRSADCVPILAADPETGRVAALHAGWRGVAARILPRLLERWRNLGVALPKVRLALGPHIRACCFQVQEDCIRQFGPEDLAGARIDSNGRTTLDLERALINQAARFGVIERNISSLALCTDCHRDAEGRATHASYRRANREGRLADRNLSFIAVRHGEPLVNPAPVT